MCNFHWLSLYCSQNIIAQQVGKFFLVVLQITGLTKRVGIVRMGGFLHKGFDSVNSCVHQHDVSIARWALTVCKLASDNPSSPLYVLSFLLCTNCSLPCNKIRNRDGSSLPPSGTRVRIQVVMEDLGSNYINARYWQEVVKHGIDGMHKHDS